MAIGEIGGWLGLGALALGVLLAIMLAVQMRRVGTLRKQYRALMKGAGEEAGLPSLGELVASQGARIEALQSQVASLQKAAADLASSVEQSMQGVGLVRYNPFQETGGDQSFVLALLDGHGDGVVMSSLHMRAMTRFYAKPVKGGSSQLSLSDEEVRALEQAMSRRPVESPRS